MFRRRIVRPNVPVPPPQVGLRPPGQPPGQGGPFGPNPIGIYPPPGQAPQMNPQQMNQLGKLGPLSQYGSQLPSNLIGAGGLQAAFGQQAQQLPQPAMQAGPFNPMLQSSQSVNQITGGLGDVLQQKQQRMLNQGPQMTPQQMNQSGLQMQQMAANYGSPSTTTGTFGQPAAGLQPATSNQGILSLSGSSGAASGGGGLF